MRLVNFLIALISTTTLIALFSWHNPFQIPLPPIGAFFNPFTGFWQNAESSTLPPHQTLHFPTLKKEVTITLDDRLVPHIFAENPEDAFFAQGYLHAQHRLWQMDIAVRSVGGRLSEVLGERTLERDRIQRRKGIITAAENALLAWERSPHEAAFINAYVAGVNAYIQSLRPKHYPLEFKLLNYAPEEWTALKCALFFKSMAETLCSGNDDLEATNAKLFWGADTFDFLYPEQNPKQSPIIPANVPWNFEPIAIQQDTNIERIGGLIRHRSIPKPPPFIGSNNWAVSGKKTASGYPILCNDPHLNLTMPSIWFEIQLSTPQFNAYGVSFPSIPGIIIGFNNNIAWGVTNVGQDVLDWYKITWADDKKEKYLLDGGVARVTEKEESILVRGKAHPVIEKVKYTVWGPIVYESAESPYQDMAMHWVASTETEEKAHYDLGTFVKLMGATNYANYSNALEGFDSPPQNFVFAAKDGDIALKVNGKFPIKRPEQGRFVQDGSYSGNKWQGFIPRAQLPQVRNPARGFVASANQRSTAPDYPYYYNGGFDDFRGRYINRRLEQMNNITHEDMMALQNDNFSIKAEEGLPALLQLLDTQSLSDWEKQLFDALRQWNYRFEKDAKAPLVFDEWFNKAYLLTFDELAAFQDSIEILYPESWRFIELLSEHAAHPVFDKKNTAAVETAAQIVTMAFDSIAVELKKLYPEGDFSWGKHKASTIRHLGRIGGLGIDFLDIGGYGDAPNAIKKAHGPSWRMVVALGEETKAWGVYPGGQSGNPGSKYYDTAVMQWANGKYYELFFMKNVTDRSQRIVSEVKMKNK